MDIYAGITANDALISLLKKWYPKSPKKANPKFINDVHQLVINANSRDLYDILYHTKYFDNVLWNFFHRDITSNHIELIVCIVLYDIEQGYGKLIDIILKDAEEFQQLFERFLNITITPCQSSTLRLQKIILLFINQLVTFKLSHPLVRKTLNGLFSITIWSNMYNYQKMLDNEELMREFNQKQSVIENCDSISTKSYLVLKRRWIYTLITSYMSLLQTGDMVQHSQFIQYLESFIQLLISCISQLPIRNYFNSMLRNLRFISCFHSIDNKNNRLLEFVKVLKYFIYFPIDDFTGEEYFEGNKYQINFYNLQKIIYLKLSESQSDKIKDFILVPSVYNYSPEKLKNFLSYFKLDDIIVIANKLQIIDHISDNFKNCDFIIDVIANDVFTPQYNIKGLGQMIDNYSEVDIIDEFNDVYKEGSMFQPIPLPQIHNTQYLCMSDYIVREVINLTTNFKQVANNHINQVLERLKLSVDPQNNLRIKGTSKYFSPIESLTIFDKSTAELIISTNKDWKDTIKINDYILLVQLMKPNKYSPHERVIKHGLNMIRFKKVLELSGKGKQRRLLINWKDDLSDRFNYIIRLPSEIASLDRLNVIDNDIDLTDIRLPEYLGDLFLGIDKPATAQYMHQGDRPRKLKIDCINVGHLKYKLEFENSKRRKGIENQSFAGDPPYILKVNEKGDTAIVQSIVGQRSAYQLNDEQAQCLVPSVSTGVTVIDSPPNSDGELLQSIICNLQLNFPKERTLVIFSNDVSLDQFEVESVKSLKVFNDPKRYDKSIEVLFGSIRTTLDQTEILAELVGLKDMGFGQTCENALLLFPKIKETWKMFLDAVKEDRLIVSSYPFKQFSKLTLGDTFENDLQKIVVSYKDITQLFQDIQNLAPIVKFLKKKDELIKFLIRKYAQYVLVTPETLISQKIYQNKFDTIISVGENIPQLTWLLPVINNPYLRRYVVLGDLSHSNKSRWRFLGVPSLKLREVTARQEFIQYYNDNYNQELVSLNDGPSANGGFKETHQIIPVDTESSSGSVSVNEAEYAVALYQYMRLLGYPAQKISIIAMTSYQKMLIQEVLSAQCGEAMSNDSAHFTFGWPIVETDDCCNPNAYLIVSAFGRRTTRLRCTVNATHGLYVVGRYNQNNFPNRSLTVVNGEMYNRLIEREPKHLYEIVGYDHLRQYVSQMTAMRTGAAK